MTGKPKPDGRRITLSIKLSQNEAEAVDQARGTTPASTWIRETILGAITVTRKPEREPSTNKTSPPEPKHTRTQPGIQPCTTPDGEHPPINRIGRRCTNCQGNWR